MSKGILYDATLCIGCKQCEQACAEKNKLPYTDAIAAEQRQSEHKFTVVLSKEDKFMRRLCMNCNEPACASVCPVAALRKTPAGPVIYEASRCMGCRYCMLACPFGVPRYEWNSVNPKVQKCTMCSDRVQAGNPTACTEICPTGATKFGERSELIAEAQQRVKENPGKYFGDHIFGMEEVGGTSVLLLSGAPFEDFGYRTDMPHDPLPGRTMAVQSKIPDFVPLWGSLLGGVWWITHRREEVAKSEDKKDGGRK